MISTTDEKTGEKTRPCTRGSWGIKIRWYYNLGSVFWCSPSFLLLSLEPQYFFQVFLLLSPSLFPSLSLLGCRFRYSLNPRQGLTPVCRTEFPFSRRFVQLLLPTRHGRRDDLILVRFVVENQTGEFPPKFCNCPSTV